VEQDGDVLKISRNEDTKEASAMHGMSRALCQNMITGVNDGFERKLELQGVGYRASVAGQSLTMNLGYSHPVVLDIPATVKASVEKNTLITIESCDKDILGNLAAVIRSKRPPEPYKGKGVRYLGEQIIMKAGKSAKK
jgi:large subunit ribosomal protein L6